MHFNLPLCLLWHSWTLLYFKRCIWIHDKGTVLVPPLNSQCSCWEAVLQQKIPNTVTLATSFLLTWLSDLKNFYLTQSRSVAFVLMVEYEKTDFPQVKFYLFSRAIIDVVIFDPETNLLCKMVQHQQQWEKQRWLPHWQQRLHLKMYAIGQNDHGLKNWHNNPGVQLLLLLLFNWYYNSQISLQF